MAVVNPNESVALAGSADWTIRPYREGDIPAIVSLLNATYTIDKRDKGVTVEEQERSYAQPMSDPPRQIILAEGSYEGVPEGMPVGYGRIMHFDDKEQGQRLYQFTVTVHPTSRGKGLERALAARLMDMARANESDPQTETIENVAVLAGVSEKSPTIRALMEEIGLKEIRQGWVMERALNEPIAEPQVIEGVIARTYRHPDDNPPALTAYNNSFIDHFEFHAMPQEIWDYVFGTPDIRPTLSWLAEVEGEPGKIAGFCICEIKDEDNKRTGRSEGWIELLGTIRGWRGKGLGRSLLLRGLHSLKEVGIQTALLGVDSESPTGATRLYESVGFKVREHESFYKCPLSEVNM